MTKQANTEYNKELILVHTFLKKLHENYMNSNKIKSNNERLSFAHAVKTVGDIAYHCNITKRETPQTHKAEFYNTIYDE